MSEEKLDIKAFEAMGKNIHDIRERLEKVESFKGMTPEEIFETSEWKTFEERVQNEDKELKEQVKKLDEKLQVLNRPSMSAEEKKADVIADFGNAARFKVLSSAKAAGERVHNLDLFAPKNTFDASGTEAKALQTDNDPRAGYLVAPREFVTEIINQSAREVSPIRQYASVMQTTSNQVDIPAKTARGVSGWVAEAGTRSEDTTLTYGMESIPLHMMYAYYTSTIEMLDDSAFNLESELMNEYSTAFGLLEGTAFCNGSGVGEPEGFSVATLGEVNSGNASALTADGLKGLYFEPKSQYIPNARWYMNRATMLAISKLKDGNGNYLLDQLGATPTWNIMGKQVVETPDLADISAGTYPVYFGDMNKAYKIIDKVVSAMTIRDIYSSKATGIVEFLMHRRVGGQVVLPEALKKQKVSA